MIITTNWINKYLSQPLSTDAIIEALEKVGFPCEERTPLPDIGDEQLDIEITSNRGDCVSVVGLAREVASAVGCEVIYPDTTIPNELVDSSRQASDVTTVDNQEHDLCPYYSARIIKGVKVGPSPQWLRDRVETVGLRSVNNIVDVTNFILFEMGQPLHTFDLNVLAERRIVVRKARKGESIEAIDGSKLTLNEHMLVIADATSPVAVAGVMGGKASEVSESSVDILLEAASFKAPNVRTTSRALKLFTDSSYRFERGIHPASVAAAADRAARLIVEVAGGSIMSGDVVAGAAMPEPLAVKMRTQRCCKIAGVAISTEQMVEYLHTLGLAPVICDAGMEAECLQCTIPPHRLDLTREVDLIEEIIRMYGFENLEPNEKVSIEVVGPQPEVTNCRAVEETLIALGFYEVVSYTFISKKHAKPFLPEGFEMLRVGDDRRKAEPILRPSVLPSLLACRKRNQDAGHKDSRFFEQAAVFGLKDGEKLENVNLAILLDAPDRQLGIREMRAAIDAVVAAIFNSTDALTVCPMDIPWFEKDGGAALCIGDEVLGTFGIVNRAIQDQHDLRTPVVAAEIGIARYFTDEIEAVSLSGFSTRPAIQRDLSVVVDEQIAWSKIEDVIGQVQLSDFELLEFVGVYRGKQVDSGKKSVTMRMTFRSSERTLRHEEIDPQVNAVIEHLATETGAILRD